MPSPSATATASPSWDGPGPLPGILSASLTIYAGGKAALTEATNFYDLKPVSGVGDSAGIDVVSKVIGLIVLARAVLQAR